MVRRRYRPGTWNESSDPDSVALAQSIFTSHSEAAPPLSLLFSVTFNIDQGPWVDLQMTQRWAVGDIFILCYIVCASGINPGRVAVPVDLVFSSASQGLTPLQRNTGKGFTEDHPPVTTNNQTQQQQRRMEQKTFLFFSVFHLLLSYLQHPSFILLHLEVLDHLKTHLHVNGFCRSKNRLKATIILKSWEPDTKNILSTKRLRINRRDLFIRIFSRFKPTPWLKTLRWWFNDHFDPIFWQNIQKSYCTVTKSLTSLSSSVIMMQVKKCGSIVDCAVRQTRARPRLLAPYLAIVHEPPINTQHPSNPLLRSARLWLTLQYVLRQKLHFQTSMMSLNRITKKT